MNITKVRIREDKNKHKMQVIMVIVVLLIISWSKPIYVILIPLLWIEMMTIKISK